MVGLVLARLVAQRGKDCGREQWLQGLIMTTALYGFAKELCAGNHLDFAFGARFVEYAHTRKSRAPTSDVNVRRQSL